MTDIGNVYGRALYDLAVSEGLSLQILSQLKVLKESFSQEPAFLKLLSLRNLSKGEQCDILSRSFDGKLHPYVVNFLKLLTEKGYIRQFSDCVDAYRGCYNEDNNILPVTAVTAVALTPEQTAQLTQKLENMTGKSVELTCRLDPHCLGGVRLELEGKCLDDTVAHRLESVRQLLKNTVL